MIASILGFLKGLSAINTTLGLMFRLVDKFSRNRPQKRIDRLRKESEKERVRISKL